MPLRTKTLPETFAYCIEFRNTHYRNELSIKSFSSQNNVQVSIGFSCVKEDNRNNAQTNKNSFKGNFQKAPYRPNINPFVNGQRIPQRITQQPGLDKPEPMEIDRSTIFEKKGSYSNRP